jgi:predicted nucleotidyltransferase component of viral defense system
VIGRQDILARAAEWRLRPDVVEKDYVLGWILVALAQHGETSEHWVFKGGTCLKKCFYETYRFSEDLDFTLNERALYDKESPIGRESSST